MQKIANGLVFLIAMLHIYFLVLEMFLWQAPIGLQTFGFDPELAAKTAVLAANQGLYNGFLAAGLLFALFCKEPASKKSFTIFFLICVIVAGVYGGLTAKIKILFVQGVPAIIALIVYGLSPKK